MANETLKAAASTDDVNTDSLYADGNLSLFLIEQDHKNLLDLNGPDKDCESKLKQIELFMRLHEAFKCGYFFRTTFTTLCLLCL